eukprot:3449333-Rhodomonas_salina.1
MTQRQPIVISRDQSQAKSVRALFSTLQPSESSWQPCAEPEILGFECTAQKPSRRRCGPEIAQQNPVAHASKQRSDKGEKIGECKRDVAKAGEAEDAWTVLKRDECFNDILQIVQVAPCTSCAFANRMQALTQKMPPPDKAGALAAVAGASGVRARRSRDAGSAGAEQR